MCTLNPHLQTSVIKRAKDLFIWAIQIGTIVTRLPRISAGLLDDEAVQEQGCGDPPRNDAEIHMRRLFRQSDLCHGRFRRAPSITERLRNQVGVARLLNHLQSARRWDQAIGEAGLTSEVEASEPEWPFGVARIKLEFVFRHDDDF